MTSHADLALMLLSNGTEAPIVMEVCFCVSHNLVKKLSFCQVKPLKHSFGPHRILGQEVSELLGAVMTSRREWKQEEYTVSFPNCLKSQVSRS